jgi:hypothetical protein
MSQLVHDISIELQTPIKKPRIGCTTPEIFNDGTISYYIVTLDNWKKINTTKNPVYFRFEKNYFLSNLIN